jgi:hypothetical protein
MMRVLGGWIALTPELDAKLLFGRHVWDCAQHADLWGRRLPELRAPAQQSEPANERVVALVELVQRVEAPEQTVERVTGVYRVLKPHLATVYEHHLTVANPVYEPPTRRILGRVIEEERRHAAAGAVVLDRLTSRDPALAQRARAWERRLLDALAAAGGVTGDVEAPLVSGAASPPDSASVAQDLVPPPPEFDPAAALGELAGPVHAHGRALTREGPDGGTRPGPPLATDELRAFYAGLHGRFSRFEVIGCARLGRQRMVKLRLHGSHETIVLQERWVPAADGWRIAAVELTRSESAPA